jgi:hypothetical protein
VSRVNQILLALALALGALLLVLEKPWAVDPYAAAEARRGAPIFRGFEPSKAVKIEIAQAGNAVVLQKGASGWTIPSLSGFRANEDAVARLLDRVRTMTRGDLVTQDPSTFVKYHVQEADAPRVKVFDETGKAAVDFYQGRPFFDPEELQNGQGRISSLDCYVRAAGSNDVYRVGDFQPLDVRANDWIPRNLYRFEVPAVQTLTLAGADIPEEIVLNHAPDGEWSLATPAGSTPANRDACDALPRGDPRRARLQGQREVRV